MDDSALQVLTDCHMRAFTVLYNAEKANRIKAKARLAAVLATVDVLAGEPDHEGYVPQGDNRQQ